MDSESICAPALIFLFFYLIQIVYDAILAKYYLALIKLTFSIAITFILNGLCQKGLPVLSWMFVLVPFALSVVNVFSLSTQPVVVAPTTPLTGNRIFSSSTQS